ncbi:lasso peptide biosynthesis B2 protein [Kitasatospora sp. NPDC051853]|uniref:lasso peptide biosynthesis B2 protein n=1 Tax=Kitasatospora sp. NPDC051853 TaxID=3364058 RepID=UPI0037930A10
MSAKACGRTTASAAASATAARPAVGRAVGVGTAGAETAGSRGRHPSGRFCGPPCHRLPVSPTTTPTRVTAHQRTGQERTVRPLPRPANPDQAKAAVLAVRSAGWCSPARTACLEVSAATVLLLAARRLSVTWCHGIAADPVRLHAWVQTEDGVPVAEPPSTLAYTPVLTIGARHHRHR